jgi:hypothetical protein
VFHFPGAIVTVHRPSLTPEERAKRTKAIHDQAAHLLKGVKA